MKSLEFLLTNYAKVKDGEYELFLEEHAAFLDCVPMLILEGAKKQKVAEWMEVFEPLTYQIVSLSNAVQNALDGTIHSKHSHNAVVRLDLSTVFILARAQLEAYLTQVADYRPTWLKVWAKMKRAIFSANPAAVTA